jgi:hypothetical protein
VASNKKTLGAGGAEGQKDRVRNQEHRPPIIPSDSKQADALSGRSFGARIAVKADATGKRVTVICACGTVREVALDEQLAGYSGPTRSAAPGSIIGRRS